MLDAERLNRIRWRCRRGMLENDLLLTRFLDARGAAIAEDEVAMLDVLLELPDNELWDLLSGRTVPEDDGVGPLLQQLRAASI
ncbi:MAG: succinate dehydrogenase assembly factor 2 [Casimicrobiaceae bacterium]